MTGGGQVSGRDGDLMRVGVEEITALAVLCGGGAAGAAAARSHIEAVDPQSLGVPLGGPLLRLQLSATLKQAAVHFCGNTQVRLPCLDRHLPTSVMHSKPQVKPVLFCCRCMLESAQSPSRCYRNRCL